MRNISKAYKRKIRSTSKKYYKSLNRKLRNLRSSNSKEFWDIINKECSDSTKDNNIALESFFEHFKNLSKDDNDINADNNHEFDPRTVTHGLNEEINNLFTSDEIMKQIKKKKNGKSPGCDNIVNEFLKHSPPMLIEVITALFNVILLSGKVPSSWSIGIIIPIYKKKGSPNDPVNYRGITLLSCIGKLFTACINARLCRFLESSGVLGEEQAGFRSGYSTTDHIFVLHSLNDIYLSKRKRVYCCFIDYKTVFDLIHRSSLWSKLISCGINGKVVNVIYNMYEQAKSCVRNNNQLSDFFTCNAGVRQGENLSPLLFSIYLNDFESYVSRHYQGLSVISNETANNVSIDDA